MAVPGSASRWFTTSDGVRLHYLESSREPVDGRRGAPTLALVPGWTMPAWIWRAQIEHFAPRLRVLALDPRGQGHSEIAATGYDYARRAGDIREWLAAAGCEDNVVLAGWSLGVLESLQLMHDLRASSPATPAATPATPAATAQATAPVRALVLVDNSVGVGEPPASDPTFFSRLRSKRRETVAGFVASMFKRPTPPHWQAALVEAALRTPLQASIDLLRQSRAREFWRDSLYATALPVLYAYSQRFAQQGEIVKARRPAIETHLFADAGHALFVDEAPAFNDLLAGFIGRAVPAAGLPRGARDAAGGASGATR
ncbi:MAG: alpha/beta hydrolase [Rubrivivax sp.]|nr:alpha/beta hydrolase [Rubrivivax sp.]